MAICLSPVAYAKLEVGLPSIQLVTNYHRITPPFSTSSKPIGTNTGLDLLGLSSNKKRNRSWEWRVRISLFQGFSAKREDLKSLKEQLFEAIAPLDRGALATPQDQQNVDENLSSLIC